MYFVIENGKYLPKAIRQNVSNGVEPPLSECIGSAEPRIKKQACQIKTVVKRMTDLLHSCIS